MKVVAFIADHAVVDRIFYIAYTSVFPRSLDAIHILTIIAKHQAGRMVL